MLIWCFCVVTFLDTWCSMVLRFKNITRIFVALEFELNFVSIAMLIGRLFKSGPCCISNLSVEQMPLVIVRLLPLCRFVLYTSNLQLVDSVNEKSIDAGEENRGEAGACNHPGYIK